MKTCSKCGEEKPLDGFYVQKEPRIKAGFSVRPYCKECDRKAGAARRRANLAAHRARDREREARIPASVKAAKARKHYAANRERVIERQLNRHYLKRASGVNISRKEVFERDGGMCRICGCDLCDMKVWHLDHIVPIALGGTHTWENVQATCRPCNSKKGARLEGQIGLPVG